MCLSMYKLAIEAGKPSNLPSTWLAREAPAASGGVRLRNASLQIVERLTTEWFVFSEST